MKLQVFITSKTIKKSRKDQMTKSNHKNLPIKKITKRNLMLLKAKKVIMKNLIMKNLMRKKVMKKNLVNPNQIQNQIPLRKPTHQEVVEIAKLFIEKGANISQINSSKENALNLHLLNPFINIELFKLLISHKIPILSGDLYSYPRSCLIQIIKNSHSVEAMKILLEHSFKKKQINDALFFTCSNCFDGADQIVQLLLDHGAEIKYETNRFPKNLLYTVLNQEKKSAELVFLILVEHEKNIYKDAPNEEKLIHVAARLGHVNAIKKLVELNMDVDAVEVHYQTPLFHAASHTQFDAINTLLELGAEPNHLDFHKRSSFFLLFEPAPRIARKFFEFGFEIQNAPDTVNKKIWKEIYLEVNSICNDFLKLFHSQYLVDITFYCQNGEIKAHKLIISHRIDKNQTTFQNLNQILRTKTKEEAKIFLEFLYSGKIEQTNEKKNIPLIKEISESIGLTNWKSKRGSQGLIPDLKKLYEDEETKDFSIIVENQPLKVHKIVLYARSGLFQGMFESVNDSSNKVQDYTNRSFESLNNFIKFLYINSLSRDLSDNILIELWDAHEYYQLNQKSPFPLLLEDLKRQRNLN
eukprot:Anaeramoba_ignava/a218972_129.p1 GENE.a218972_129~~a218972_129.p1  ORF type:complete len:581 (-),score=175.19 a218972_129:20-1762(-)